MDTTRVVTGGVLTFDGLHVHIDHLRVLVHHLPGLHEDLALLPQQVGLGPEQLVALVRGAGGGGVPQPAVELDDGGPGRTRRGGAGPVLRNRLLLKERELSNVGRVIQVTYKIYICLEKGPRHQ